MKTEAEVIEMREKIATIWDRVQQFKSLLKEKRGGIDPITCMRIDSVEAQMAGILPALAWVAEIQGDPESMPKGCVSFEDYFAKAEVWLTGLYEGMNKDPLLEFLKATLQEPLPWQDRS